jgi:hypothetical protein
MTLLGEQVAILVGPVSSVAIAGHGGDVAERSVYMRR